MFLQLRRILTLQAVELRKQVQRIILDAFVFASMIVSQLIKICFDQYRNMCISLTSIDYQEQRNRWIFMIQIDSQSLITSTQSNHMPYSSLYFICSNRNLYFFAIIIAFTILIVALKSLQQYIDSQSKRISHSRMIKSIIQKIMIKQFSKYINGIEYNKLTVELLGGYFSIENISLNHQFFNTLETPFQVTFSHIGKLSIQAPLTKLSSVPVSCTIEDVYVITQHKRKIYKHTDETKQALLHKFIHETFDAFSTKIKQSKKEQGMLDKLGKKILDNLKINIKNIHIRFEEDNTEHTYSFGVSLKSLTFGNTDKEWKPVFIQREKGKDEEQPVYKCMTIQNLKLYWQSIAKENAKQSLFLTNQNPKQRIKNMRNFVTNNTDSILNINSSVKLIINPNSFTTHPLFQVFIDLDAINIKFSKQKIVQIIDFSTTCIKHNEIMLKSLLDKALKKVTHQQEKKFKPICGKFVSYALQNEKQKENDKKKIGKELRQTFKELFEQIPIQYLYEYSTPFIRDKVQQAKEKQLKKDKKGWFSSAQVQLTSQQKSQVQKILDQLVEDSLTKGRPPSSPLLKLKLSLKGIYFMFYDDSINNKLKNIELSIQNILCVLQRTQDSSYLAVQSKIQKIVANLTIEENKRFKLIQLMQNINEKADEFLIEMIYRKSTSIGKKTIINYFSDLSLRKTLFTYKKQYWKLFKSFFSLPQINQQVQNQALGKLELLKQQSSQDDEEIQIQKHYNIGLNLQSPTFILPLTEATFWYLDLGRITMKSETRENKFVYPFKLADLNMRYITGGKNIIRSQQLLKDSKFFPIIKNINVAVNMTTIIGTNIVDFDIQLDKIELNATKQQFSNLMKVKKFLQGQQKDQIELYNEQIRQKQQLLKKKRLQAKILKRNKYFYIWIQYYCLLSNNNLYFYSNEKELVPQSIIPLRGGKINKNKEVDKNVLEIAAGGETLYIKFKEEDLYQNWCNEIQKNFQELKDFHSLILEGGVEEAKTKRKRRQDYVNINLTMRQMSWNYLNDKGQSFMRIQLKNINFRAAQKQQKIQSYFKISSLTITDKVFQYSNKKYQHLFLVNSLVLTIAKTKQRVTKINPAIIDISVKNFNINWKPDALLLIIEAVKEFLEVKPINIRRKDNSRRQIIDSLKVEEEFKQKIETYDNLGKSNKIKQKRNSYLKMNEKDDQTSVKFNLLIDNLDISFIHRQSHMAMALLKSQSLCLNLLMGKVQKYIQGSIKTLQLFQISGYPQKSYDITAQYPPFCLFSKNQLHKESNLVNFTYTSYDSQQIANQQRVDSFLLLRFAPIKIVYLQEVVMRLIDYFQIQILLLLSHSQVITINEDILKQIKDGVDLKVGKPKNFLQAEFELVVKSLLHPFFMDYVFMFESPEIVMSPTKDNSEYFSIKMKSIQIVNNPHRESRRFANIKYEFNDNIYEDDVTINAKTMKIYSVCGSKESQMVGQPFDLTLVINRLLFEDQINEITPQIIGYDRSFKLQNYISAIRIPQLSRTVYQNLLRLPNFNLNFEDNNNELFIHNYKLTKTLSPKPIRYKLVVEEVAANAQHFRDGQMADNYKLWSFSLRGFTLQVNRDEKLNMIVNIGFQSIDSKVYEYTDTPQFKTYSQKSLVRTLKKNNSSNNYALIKMPNTGIIDIQCCIEQCQLNMNFSILPLIADWVEPDESVFAISNKNNRLIKFLIRLPSIVVNLSDENMYGQSLKLVGDLTIDATRKQGESQNYLRGRHLQNSINPNMIQKLPPFMMVKLSLGFECFTQRLGKDRKILEKVRVDLREQYYYKIRNNNFRKTVCRRLNISQLKGCISVDDIILFKSIIKSKVRGQLYGKQYKQKIRVSQDLQKSVHRQEIFQQKIIQEFVFGIEQIKFYLIVKQGSQFLPILRLFTHKISLIQFINKQNQVYNADLDLEIYYFNNRIFRWEPLLENALLKLTYTVSDNSSKVLEAQVTNNIYLNLSSEVAVSIKKCLHLIDLKLLQYKQGKYQPEEGSEYHSRYVIRNLTGYPLEIYDDTHKSQYFIMHEEQIRYISKKLQENFFEENEISEQFSFLIHHPSYQLLQIIRVSLEGQKSFQVELTPVKGRKLPSHCKIYIQNSIDGQKKVLTIRSRKMVSDYSNNILKRTYYPFDIGPEFTFTEGIHKGIKANFFSQTRNENFIYEGVDGNIIVRKRYLVYNYTVIPLNICDNVVIPGEFVGINGQLTIQGLPQKNQLLKVVENKQRQQYYIYCTCYIIDYAGLMFQFQEDYQISKLFSYHFKEQGRNIHIYLLPNISSEFSVKCSKQSSSYKLNGKLAREQFKLTADNSTYAFACYSRLESFCKNNIKDFKKVIEITNAYVICNDCKEELVVSQLDAVAKEKIVLSSKQNKIFNWSNRFLKQLIVINIQDEQEWGFSAPLTIDRNIDTFNIRNKKNPNIYKIFSMQIQERNNITFIHLLNADKNYQICNDFSDIRIFLYQTAIFQSQQKIQLLSHFDPDVYIYRLQPREKKSFGFELPLDSREITVKFQSLSSSQPIEHFALKDIETKTSETFLTIFKNKRKIAIKLQFARENKRLCFHAHREKIFQKEEKLQMRIRVKSILVSLIGLHEGLRKELISANFELIQFQFALGRQFTQINFQIQNVRIQNTLKAEPYFVSLFCQQQEINKSALKFALKRSTYNPNLIYYVGVSLRKSIITVTSEQLQILTENVSSIKQAVQAKSDTNLLLNLKQTFQPSSLAAHTKLYFVEAELHPLKLQVTYKHVNNWGGVVLKALSLNNCKLTVNGKKIKDFVTPDLVGFLTIMTKYFKEECETELFSMIGSLALLGSPLNLASKIGCGLQNLIELPADGFQEEGMLGVGKGLIFGTGSLISNTFEGAFGSVQSLTGAIGQGISGLSSYDYDKNYEKKRQQIKNERVDHVGDGLVSGGKSIFNGLFTGITGFVTEPLKGTQKQGLKGFFKGGLKGITGLIVKPVSGVIDATSKTAEGIKNTTKMFSSEAKQAKRRRYNPRPFYGSFRQIRPYDPNLAEWSKGIALALPKLSDLSWSDVYPTKDNLTILLSYQYLVILSKKDQDIIYTIECINIQKVTINGQQVLVTAIIDEDRQKIPLQPKDHARFSEELFRIFNFYHKNYDTGADRSKKA